MYIVGLISGQVVLPLAIWITIQIGYTLLAVRAPLIYKNLTQNKRKSRILHIVSVVIGIVSLVVPAVFTLAFGGYTLIDTRFPPIVCLTRERDVVAYTILIPLGILMALIVSFLVLILHTLIRYDWHGLTCSSMPIQVEYALRGSDMIVMLIIA